MTRNRLILHVGAPKCGSSSLQTALSRRPDFEARTGERFRYAVVSAEGTIITGETLVRRAEGLICRYAVSATIEAIALLDGGAIAAIASELAGMLAETSVILSCESWIADAEIFARLGWLGTIGHEVEVVAYVRPQADYLNAAWWQWTAWSRPVFEEWLYFAGFLTTCLWSVFLRDWAAIDGVTAVRPRLLRGDIVAGFFESLDCDPGETTRANRSLPGVALRFLQRNPALRPGWHDSDIDFVLERALGDWSDPVPWVLPLDYVGSIVAKAHGDNQRLRAMLTPAEQAAMDADLRWWDAAAYRARPAAPPAPPAPDADEMDAFAGRLARALLEAEREIARLRDGAARRQPAG